MPHCKLRLSVRLGLSTKALIASVLFLLSLNAASAAELKDGPARWALNNLHHEGVVCSTYFTVVQSAFLKTGDNELIAKYAALQERLNEDMAVIQELVGLSQEALEARWAMSMENQLDAIDRDFTNLDVLVLRYGKRCRDLVIEFRTRVVDEMERAAAEVLQ